MRPSIPLGLLVATFGVATIGCRDSAPAAPQQVLDIRDPASGGGSGSGSDSGAAAQPTPPTAPAQPGPGPDTAIAPTPPLPATFSLTGVARGVESGTDTTRTIPLAGVTAHLYRVKSAHGATVGETLVGSAVADANGEFVFRDITSAYYRLDVIAPAGGVYADGSVSIAPPWATEIRVSVVLHRKS